MSLSSALMTREQDPAWPGSGPVHRNNKMSKGELEEKAVRQARQEVDESLIRHTDLGLPYMI